MTREQKTHTLRCDWFVNGDGTECEVHEMFPDEQGLIEHGMHIMEARSVLFRDFAYDHQLTLYGEVSQDFINLVTERMGAPNSLLLRGGTRTDGRGLALHQSARRVRRR